MSWTRLRLVLLSVFALLVPVAAWAADPLTISPTTATVTVNMTQTFMAAGGTAPYNFTLQTNGSSGSVDSASGLYHAGNTPNAHDVVVVNDSLGAQAFAQVTTAASNSGGSTPLALTPRTVTVAPLGKISFAASGGRAPYGFAITHNGSQGSITVGGQYTAGTVGSSSDTITLIDADQTSLTATVTVGPGVTITPQGASVPSSGTRTFTASGGTGAPYSWSTTGGTITSDGALTAPADAGQIIITATDGNGNKATTVVTVGGAISITPSDATVAPHGTVQLTAGGGSGTGYTFVLTTSPATGATIDAGSGLYTAPATGDVTDTVQVSDSEGSKAVATIHVSAATDSDGLKLTAYGSTNVTGGATVQFTAAGGSGQGYVFSVPINPSGGSINAAGLYTAGNNSGIDTIRVTDSAGAQASATVQVTVLPNDNLPNLDGGATVPGSSSSSSRVTTVTVGGGDGGCASAPSNGTSGVAALALGLVGLALFRRRK